MKKPFYLRKIMWVLLLIVSTISLSFAQNKNNVNISFKIKGIRSTLPYVYIMGNSGACNLNIQTTKHISNERTNVLPEKRFTVYGNVNETVILRMTFSEDKNLSKWLDRGFIPTKGAGLWVIVSPNSNFEVTGDLTGKDFCDLYPTVDDENSIMAKLTKKLMPIENIGANATVKMILGKGKLSENSLDSLKMISKESVKQQQEIKLAFLNENSSSIAALWLMEDMLVRSQIEINDLEKIFKKVDAKKYGNNYFYKAIKDRIQGSKNTAIGAKCPLVFGKNLVNGKNFKLSDIKGKYVLIDFWGTWCGACLHGMPSMKAFADKHLDKLELVGLAKDTDEKLVLETMKKNNISWTNMLIGKGESDFVAKFNVQGFPTKILISPKGKIILKETGESEEFYKKVEKLISE